MAQIAINRSSIRVWLVTIITSVIMDARGSKRQMQDHPQEPDASILQRWRRVVLRLGLIVMQTMVNSIMAAFHMSMVPGVLQACEKIVKMPEGPEELKEIKEVIGMIQEQEQQQQAAIKQQRRMDRQIRRENLTAKYSTASSSIGSFEKVSMKNDKIKKEKKDKTSSSAMESNSQVKTDKSKKEKKDKSSSSAMGSVTNPNDTKCYCNKTVELHVTRKQGANFGRKFLRCPAPRGHQCDYFMWIEEPKDQQFETMMNPKMERPKEPEKVPIYSSSSSSTSEEVSSEDNQEFTTSCNHQWNRKGSNHIQKRQTCVLCGLREVKVIATGEKKISYVNMDKKDKK